MEKPWLKHYPAKVPAEIGDSAFSSVTDIFNKSCLRFAGRPAFECMGRTLSYADLDRESRNFAAFLQTHLGLKKGDRIALQMPNVLQYPVALMGALRAGLIVVNTNPLYTPREMEYQFADSGAKAVVILANFASHLEGILAKTKIENIIVTELGDMLSFPKNMIVNSVVKRVKKLVPPYNLPQAYTFKEALSKGASMALSAVSNQPEDIAFLQYTGGTTGVSKGAMLTHKNMVSNMEQISAWINPYLIEGEETIITALPLYHIFSLTVNALAFMKIGSQNILITNPKDIPAFIQTLKKRRFTAFTGVNTLFNALLNHPEFKTIDFTPLKVTVGGGMAVQQNVAKRWKEVTGVSVVEGYGLTESSPVLCVNRIDGQDRLGTIGLPLPSTDVKIFDDNFKEVPLGQPGELCAKGPQIMKGYWQKPQETDQVIKDGWLKTGDIAVMDQEGYFKIVDRKKDMILVSGFNVYPNEIEEVVASHSGVLEVAAIGVTDERSGEAVKIFVVKKQETLTEEDIKKHCKEKLTAYKVPKFVEFRKELPKTNVGKILRRALKESSC